MAYVKYRMYGCSGSFLQERSTDFIITSKRRRRKKMHILMHKFKK
jgi:hypothetical protein